jgi:hypothetical protein
MPKEIKNKREDKKKPAMTPKEKKAAKRTKRLSGNKAFIREDLRLYAWQG